MSLLGCHPPTGKCFGSIVHCDNQEAAGPLLCWGRLFLKCQRADINTPSFLTNCRKGEGGVSFIILNILHAQNEGTFPLPKKVGIRNGEKFWWDPCASSLALTYQSWKKHHIKTWVRLGVSLQSVEWFQFCLLKECVWFLTHKHKSVYND